MHDLAAKFSKLELSHYATAAGLGAAAATIGGKHKLAVGVTVAALGLAFALWRQPCGCSGAATGIMTFPAPGGGKPKPNTAASVLGGAPVSYSPGGSLVSEAR